MRLVALASCGVLAVGGCRRHESQRTIVVGPATYLSQRTCDWADWENTSCGEDGTLVAGSARITGIREISASPRAERVRVQKRTGELLLVDTRTGAAQSLPGRRWMEPWCDETAFLLRTPLTEDSNSELEFYWLEHGEALRSTIVYAGERNVAKLSCGPQHTLALVLASAKPGAPVGLYHWSEARGLQRVEDWPGALPDGDAADIEVSWTDEGRPAWCVRTRPYTTGECLPPPRPSAR
ncbi:hypothetical protein JGU66_27240 [Myxococcaceae bacterium JPH2]|nr:hypothetical protein [Myxococcaceae bacterium JPH2]